MTQQQEDENLIDLISGFSQRQGEAATGASGKKEEKMRSGKGKGGEK